MPQISNHPSAKKLRWMNGIQIALVVIASLIFVLAPYLEFEPTDKFTLFDVAILIGLICLAANIVCFMVFVIKQKEDRQDFLLQGIRNILFIPAVNIASQMHTSCWAYMDNSMVEYKLYDLWYPEYLGYAICFALAVIVVFAVINKIVKKDIK